MDKQRKLSVLAVELVADATAQDGVGPSHQVRLVPHVMASFGVFSRLPEGLGGIAEDLLTTIDRMEIFLYKVGKRSEAYTVGIFHFTRAERTLGKEHPDTLRSMKNLASVLRSQGSYEEAERIHRQALALRETVLGKEHPHTLTSMNNLTFTSKRQGQNTKAINLMSESVHLRTRILGANHPYTLSSFAAFTKCQIQKPERSSYSTNNMTISK